MQNSVPPLPHLNELNKQITRKQIVHLIYKFPKVLSFLAKHYELFPLLIYVVYYIQLILKCLQQIFVFFHHDSSFLAKQNDFTFVPLPTKSIQLLHFQKILKVYLFLSIIKSLFTTKYRHLSSRLGFQNQMPSPTSYLCYSLHLQRNQNSQMTYQKLVFLQQAQLFF